MQDRIAHANTKKEATAERSLHAGTVCGDWWFHPGLKYHHRAHQRYHDLVRNRPTEGLATQPQARREDDLRVYQDKIHEPVRAPLLLYSRLRAFRTLAATPQTLYG